MGESVIVSKGGKEVVAEFVRKEGVNSVVKLPDGSTAKFNSKFVKPAPTAAPSSQGESQPVASPDATPSLATSKPISPSAPAQPASPTPPPVEKKPIDYTDPYESLPFTVRNRTGSHNERLEDFFARRKKAGRFYQEDMLKPDGTVNWETSELWDYLPLSHFWFTYEVLYKYGETTYGELVKKVVALGKERTPDKPIRVDRIREQIKGILRKEPSVAPPGFGTLVSRGPAPGFLKLVYDPQVALQEWRKFTRSTVLAETATKAPEGEGSK